ARRLDRAPNLVAPLQALAQLRLETSAGGNAVWRAWACQPRWVNSLFGFSEGLNLRESCLREMCTGSLGGGRGLARKCTSSDPTARKAGNAGRGKGPGFRALAKGPRPGDWRSACKHRCGPEAPERAIR